MRLLPFSEVKSCIQHVALPFGYGMYAGVTGSQPVTPVVLKSAICIYNDATGAVRAPLLDGVLCRLGLSVRVSVSLAIFA